jgi:hypothetical protein
MPINTSLSQAFPKIYFRTSPRRALKVHIFRRTRSTCFSSDHKYICFAGPEVHIFRRTRSAYFSPDQKYIFFVGPKVHIFRRTRSAYFSPAQKCIFFVGPKAHIFRQTKSAYFSPAQKCIFSAGPEVHIFRQTTSAYFSPDQKCMFFVGGGNGPKGRAQEARVAGKGGGLTAFAKTANGSRPLALGQRPASLSASSEGAPSYR